MMACFSFMVFFQREVDVEYVELMLILLLVS